MIAQQSNTLAQPDQTDAPSALEANILAVEAAWQAFTATNNEHDGHGPEVVAADSALIQAMEDLRCCRPSDWIELTRKALALEIFCPGLEMGERNLSVIAKDAAQLAGWINEDGGTSLAIPGTNWRALIASYDDALAEYARAKELEEAAWAAAMADAPMPAELKRGCIEYRTVQCIKGAKDIDFDQKAVMLEIQAEWAGRHDNALQWHRHAELEAATTAADNRVVQIIDQIEALPVTGLDAVLAKLRVRIDQGVCDEIGESANDPASLSRILTCPDSSSSLVAVETYLDLLRIADPASPALQARCFDAKAWIVNFEAKHPGCAIDRFGPEAVTPDGPKPAPPEIKEAWDALPRWQRKEIYKAAKVRDDWVVNVAGSFFQPRPFIEAVKSVGGYVGVHDGELQTGGFVDKLDPFRLAALWKRLVWMGAFDREQLINELTGETQRRAHAERDAAWAKEKEAADPDTPSAPRAEIGIAGAP